MTEERPTKPAEVKALYKRFLYICSLWDLLKIEIGKLEGFQLIDSSKFKSVSEYIEEGNRSFDSKEQKVNFTATKMRPWLRNHKEKIKASLFFDLSTNNELVIEVKNYYESCGGILSLHDVLTRFNEAITKEEGLEKVPISELVAELCNFKSTWESVVKESPDEFRYKVNYLIKVLDQFVDGYEQYLAVFNLDQKLEKEAMEYFCEVLNRDTEKKMVLADDE